MEARVVSIRVASSLDATKIAEVHVASWHETYRGIVPDAILTSLSVERRAKSWQRILDNPAEANDTMVTVAELGDELVGFGACGAQRTAGLVADGFDGEIGAIYVLSAYQRRGIGKQLTHAMTLELLRRSYHGVALWVLRDNAQARGFYEWCEGKVVGTREDIRGNDVLPEVAYGWYDLSSLNRKLNH